MSSREPHLDRPSLRAVLTAEEKSQRRTARRLREEVGRSLEAVERALRGRGDRRLVPLEGDLLRASDAVRHLALEVDPGPGVALDEPSPGSTHDELPGDVLLLPALRRYALGVAARSRAALRMPPGDGPPVPREAAVQLYRIFQRTARAVSQSGPGTALRVTLERAAVPGGVPGARHAAVVLCLEITPEDLSAPVSLQALPPLDLLAARCALVGATLTREPLGNGGLRLEIWLEIRLEGVR